MFRIVVALVFVMLGGIVFVGCREDSGRGERREDGRGGGDGDAFLVGFAEVRDGDSFLLGGEEVRLLGIDAPEYDQECGEGEDVWRCGEVAKGMLEGFVRDREARCALSFRDVHERWLSRCFVGGEDLGKLMVGGGMAIATRREYRLLMRGVRGERRGVWGGCLEKPERWRGGRRGCWHR